MNATQSKMQYPTLFGCAPGAGGRVVVVGVPYDRGTDNIPGAALAPAILRELTAPAHNRIESGSLRDLATGEVVLDGPLVSDLGDLRFRPTQSDDAFLDFVTSALRVVAREGKSTLVLGGDHLVTLAVLRGLAGARRPFQVVQLDAHFDYGETESTARPTHGSFMGFVASEGLAERIVQVGVRGYFASAPPPVPAIRQATLAGLDDALLPDLDVYLTIDTDAFDPSCAPAVSYPVPRGLAPSAVDDVLAVIASRGRRLIGADWTEYNPVYDAENRITGRIIVDALVRVLARLARDAGAAGP